MAETNEDDPLSEAEVDDVLNKLDDQSLMPRIKNLIMGDPRPDPEGETPQEQSELIIATIARQLRSGNPSRAAIGYLTHCLERYLSDDAASLDQAFFIKPQRAGGGQPVSDKVERHTVVAYMNVIRKKTWIFDREFGCMTYSMPDKEVRREACQAAFEAYRRAVGKDWEDDETEKKINQTIKPLLRRKRVWR